MTQAQALDILKTGANVFLSGEPGAGKTHTVNSYVRYLREHKIEPAITASTGIAATHLGGMTIHSWSGIGIKSFLDDYALDKITSSEYVAKRVAKAKVLVLDEVSMLGPNVLDMVDAVCRGVRRSSESFGGLQVILVGDFFQLPPVKKGSDPFSAQRPSGLEEKRGLTPFLPAGETQILFDDVAPARFAYESPAWARANFLTCYLHEQYRQDDMHFLELLAAIRGDYFDEAHLERLAPRRITRETMPADIPKLYTHNVDVDRVNEAELEKIPGKRHEFKMVTDGPEKLVETLKKGCLSPECLGLKVGASVMFTKNKPVDGFVNGTLGMVTAIEGAGAGAFGMGLATPIVQTKQGKRIRVEPMDWTVEEEGKVRARVTQVPLRLSWAMTVHKSQGVSLDAAIMDLSQVFEYGQGYVALSRVRRLSGLHLLGWNAQAFRVHPGVLEQDHRFRESSEGAEAEFEKLPPKEIATMHENFVRACGGRAIAQKEARRKREEGATKTATGTTDRFTELRKKHPNAYRRWNESEDELLTKLFKKSIPQKELAERFGRQRGAIHARLVKLGLVEDDRVAVS